MYFKHNEGNELKMNENKKIINFIYCLILMVLIFPRSFEVLIPQIHEIVNFMKIIVVFVIGILCVKKRIRLSKFSIATFIFIFYIFLITLVNGHSIFYFLKTYALNIGIILFCELIFQEENKMIYLKNFAHLFLAMLIINLLGMFVCKGIYQSYYFGDTLMCLLGQDNRVILYLIPPVLIYFYDYALAKQKVSKFCLFLTYLIGTITLYLFWSVAALMVFLIIIIANILINKTKIKINLNVAFVFIILLNIGIVFFRVQNLFEFVIVDILHKSLDLSYRTNIWDMAMNLFKLEPLKFVFGHGFFDITNVFEFTVIKSSNIVVFFHPNHLHNIIMNNLFFGGLVGTILYFNLYLKIIQNNNRIKNENSIYNMFSVIFLSLQLLLIFDTYEHYQIYYFILFWLYAFPTLVIENLQQKEMDCGFEDFKQKKITDSVAIMMATYNGEKYIAEQLNTIVQQSYKNWTLYISDDHSNDKTLEIIEQFRKKYKRQIIIVQNDNKFNDAKLNFANLYDKVGEHDYYMFCDQDDAWDSDKIYKLLYFIKSKEEKEKNVPILVYSDCYITDSNLNIISKSLIHGTWRELPEKQLLNHVLVQNYFPGCAVLFNKKLKKITGTIYKKCEMHDWWLTQVASYCGRIYFWDQPLHYYRQHENNTIGAQKTNGKWSRRLKKILKYSSMHDNWKKFQKTIILQANELNEKFCDGEYKDAEKIVNRFVSIMSKKNKLLKIVNLYIYGYRPSEIIRIIRLV